MRSRKLTTARRQIICDHLAIGGTIQAACALARISDESFLTWRRYGVEARQKLDDGGEITPDERVFLEFLEAINDAEAQAEQFFIGQVYTAAQTDPAHAWRWLERRRKEFAPPRFGEEGNAAAEVVIRIVYGNADKSGS